MPPETGLVILLPSANIIQSYSTIVPPLYVPPEPTGDILPPTQILAMAATAVGVRVVLTCLNVFAKFVEPTVTVLQPADVDVVPINKSGVVNDVLGVEEFKSLTMV